eukprot:537744-Rhodomonas_salina.1
MQKPHVSTYITAKVCPCQQEHTSIEQHCPVLVSSSMTSQCQHSNEQDTTMSFYSLASYYFLACPVPSQQHARYWHAAASEKGASPSPSMQASRKTSASCNPDTSPTPTDFTNTTPLRHIASPKHFASDAATQHFGRHHLPTHQASTPHLHHANRIPTHPHRPPRPPRPRQHPLPYRSRSLRPRTPALMTAHLHAVTVQSSSWLRQE